MTVSGTRFSDLGVRALSAVVLLVVSAIALILGSYLFVIFLSLAAGIMVWEMGCFTPNRKVVLTFIGLSSALCVFCSLGSLYSAGFVLFFATLCFYLVAMNTEDVLRRTIAIASIMIGAITIGFLRSEFGLTITLWVLACVIATDMGGYFFGKLIGGPKFWPAVSPGKTWSGMIGGWILTVATTFVFIFAIGGINHQHVILSVLISIFSQMGDLFESSLKRRAGVKDSSNLIPGHGGFLDRFDGLLGASIFLFVVFIAGQGAQVLL